MLNVITRGIDGNNFAPGVFFSKKKKKQTLDKGRNLAALQNNWQIGCYKILESPWNLTSKMIP